MTGVLTQQAGLATGPVIEIKGHLTVIVHIQGQPALRVIHAGDIKSGGPRLAEGIQRFAVFFFASLK